MSPTSGKSSEDAKSARHKRSMEEDDDDKMEASCAASEADDGRLGDEMADDASVKRSKTDNSTGWTTHRELDRSVELTLLQGSQLS